MKVGDTYESPGGLGFVIKALDKKTVTVDVDRVYEDKDGKRILKVNERVMPRERFEGFARPYKKV